MQVVLRVLCLLTLVLVAGSAAAQQVQVRVVEARPDGAVLEVTAAWPRTLTAPPDSAGAVTPLRKAAWLGAAGGTSASHALALPALALPALSVVAADFEEARFAPADATEQAWLDQLPRAPVAALGLGYERKRPAATVTAHLVTYDPATQMLRRYSRLLVSARFGGNATGPGSARLLAGAPNPHLAVTRSVLAEGTVFKIPVAKEGVYRIDRAFLQALGLNPATIEPNNLKVYGNGGAPLPALNSAPRPADLVENPVFVTGGGDGAFNEGDLLLFYAAGPSGWTYHAGTGRWEHYVNPFSTVNYYFLKVDGGAGKRVGQEPFPAYPDAALVAQVTGRHFLDLDEYMWSIEDGSGLTWLSRLLTAGETRPLFDNVALPGLDGGEVRFEARAGINSNPSANLSFLSGSTPLGAISVGPISRGGEADAARMGVTTFTQALGANARLNVAMRLQNQSNDPQAALDWIRLTYPQSLRAEGNYLRFATPAERSGRLELVLNGFSTEPQVWDVTEPGAVKRLGVRAQGSSYRVQLEVAEGAPREIVAFTQAAAQALGSQQAARVPAQNLHGIATYPDFVIVTPAAFAAAANAHAQRRRAQGLRVEVVDVAHIYNEFSGGLPDMRAVRDYFKFLYDRAPDDEARLRYALLLGDGHFNYRQIGGESPLANWILPYESDNSVGYDASYTSDDYFGLLDDDEGIWRYVGQSNPSSERVDIGVGRLPAQSAQEAAMMIEKIRRYEDPATYGPWRTRYTFVADDEFNGRSGDENESDLHLQNTDVVATLVAAEAPRVNQQKIYAASYTRVYQGEWRIPGAREDIRAALNEGTLFINYSGHGGTVGLAQEAIFTKQDAETLTNGDKLSIFITATCSFGRWDMQDEQSGAEALLLNPDGGAVALLTTVRAVYTSASLTTLNVGLNRELNRALFTHEADGQLPRLGDALRQTKNTAAGLQDNNRKFNLLGDPTMRPGLPAAQAAVETVNGQPVAEAVAPLQALDRVTIAGVVKDAAGAHDPSFNGLVTLSVFDAARQVPIDYRLYNPTPYYVTQQDLIWSGQVTAREGQFTAQFVVPKDISYSNRSGRISVYAQSAAGQALGFTENVRVGGTAPNPPTDTRGPELRLFLNDTTFAAGGQVPPDPTLIVKLFDETGINTVGAGVGHEMLLVLNGDDESAVNLSGFFRTEPDSYQRGQVTYALKNLPAGANTLSVKAWDVLNNSATATLDFVVGQAEALRLTNVLSYPNPTTGPAEFIFDHNRATSTPARVQIRIYTLDGRPVRTLETEALLGAGPVRLAWDGLDDDFDRLATGIYLYKVRVEVDGLDGGRQVSEIIERLALIR